MKSAKKQSNRTIPRIFIFDCCSGSGQREEKRRNDNEKGKNIVIGLRKDDMKDNNDHKSLEESGGKNVPLDSIHRSNSLIWAQDEYNPDFQLVTINAANEGFQSKMSSVKGSYVIQQFTEKIGSNLKNNNYFLQEILDDIQEDLHNKGKQLMIQTFNNKTEFIKFLPNN